MMRIDILTLFPEMFHGVLGSSILKRAGEKKLACYHLHQLRDYTTDPHGKVDVRPFGGGGWYGIDVPAGVGCGKIHRCHG